MTGTTSKLLFNQVPSHFLFPSIHSLIHSFIQFPSSFFSGERTLLNECGVDGLLRGTESNKKIALEWFEGLELREVFSSNTDLGNMTALVEEGFDLIKAAINSPNNADSGCEPVFLLLSTQQPDGDTVNYMNSENEEYGVRLFTFGLASATDPEVPLLLLIRCLRLHSYFQFFRVIWVEDLCMIWPVQMMEPIIM